MKAEILSIGTELLMGELTDTNAPFIASQLPALGIQLQWVSQVGDNLDMLTEAFTSGLGRSDIIFTTGGLGPTQDDLTREAIANALGEEMTVRDDLLDHLQDYFRRRGTEMPSTNLKQATVIPSAQSIPNQRGTAPGWWVERACSSQSTDETAAQGKKIIVSMPGPPVELRGIWEAEVVPRLKQEARGEVILTRNIKTTGLSEGLLDEMVAEYLGRENPYLGIYAKSDGIHLRIIARAPDEEAARSIIQPVERGLVSIVGPYIWGYDDETPERAVGLLLTQNKLTLATMESLTGGLLASSITADPGSSSYFKGGIVLYSTDDPAIIAAVPVLGRTIEKYGFASEESARAMAEAAREQLKADIGVGVTGVAGTEDIQGQPASTPTPQGTIHIAISYRGDVRYFHDRLPPRRSVIRVRAASTALVELRRLLDQPVS